MRCLVLVLFLCAVGNPAFADSSSASEPSNAETHMAQGLSAFQRGEFENAIVSWTEAARLYDREGKLNEQSKALTQLAQAYQSTGQHKEALKNLELARDLAEKSGDRTQAALVLAGLGNAHIATGPDTAHRYLNEGLALARELQNSSLTAAILNNLGNFFTSQKKYSEAIAAYQESITLAKETGNRSLAARALVNAGMASLGNGQHQESKTMLDTALDQIQGLDQSHDKAHGLINIGLAYHDLRPHLAGFHDALLLLASKTFNEAASVANTTGDRRMASYAWGYLGTLYEDERRYEEALQLTRRAIFAAQQVNAPESLYRWQWQAGRLLKKLGTMDEAISAYRRAVSTLQSIRLELLVSHGGRPISFRESVGPVYFELVDLLLQRGGSLQIRDQVGPYLVEARETVELFKVAELRDYFRDDCVDTALAKVTKLDVVTQTAVVVYPIILPDRTELLVSLPSGLKRFSVPVGAETLTKEVRQFRLYLEKRTTREYLPHAQQLYNWLIRPLEPELASLRIDSLIFVPDGALRTIPMAALHDGKEFLVNKYALGITPTLNLTDPHPIKREQMKVLAVGVTESVQGFPPLPDVATEIQALGKLFPSTTLVDQEFLAANLEKKLKGDPFTVVHIASHAQFGSSIENTFLLTFDDKVTMNRLDQYVGVFKFRDEPLELLTLSACETAAGDDRAALGLAGVAIKAGARSALATLWNINDRASSELVVEFYRGLKDPSISRATALQRAQLKLLTDPRYEHPGFWSPYLLINNWL